MRGTAGGRREAAKWWKVGWQRVCEWLGRVPWEERLCGMADGAGGDCKRERSGAREVRWRRMGDVGRQTGRWVQLDPPRNSVNIGPVGKSESSTSLFFNFNLKT